MSRTAVADDNNRKTWDRPLVDVVEYVYDYEVDVKSRAWSKARVALLDALSCAIETQSKSSECRRLLGPLVPGAVVQNGFRLPGTTYELDPIKGAFDLGACIRWLDHNDAIGGAEAGHPSDNLGSIVALCDWISRAQDQEDSPSSFAHIPSITTRTVLEALIKAYEIQGCFQLQNAFNKYGHDHVILVKLASVAVCSWILRLDKEQALAAVSHVFMDGSPLRVYRNAPNTISRKSWAAGDACARALQLVLLARKGVPGAHSVLTAPRWGFYANLFGGNTFTFYQPFGTWTVENIFFKCVPAEGHGISAVDAALQQARILEKKGLDPIKNIKKIRIRTHAAVIRIINKHGPLHNAADRDHCIQYMVAVTLLKKSLLSSDDYLDSSPWAKSKAVESLRDRIDIIEDDTFTQDYLNPKVKSAANAISIDLSNGDSLPEIIVHYPVGHVEHPDTERVVRGKFWWNMEISFSKEETDQILVQLEDDRKPFSQWLDLWIRNDNVGQKRSRL